MKTQEQDKHPLEICLSILKTMGSSGKYVWDMGKIYSERYKDPLPASERLEYLKTAIYNLRKKTQEDQDYRDKVGNPMYRELPVDFRTFVESPHFMDKMRVLWPVVMQEGEEINSGKYVECVLTGSIGVAKALDVNTPIPTPSGYSRMGKLRTGDKIFGADGEVCTVTCAHPVWHNQECYKVLFSDGTSIVAEAGHLWKTSTRTDPYLRVRNTLEIKNSLIHRGRVNHCIPSIKPLRGQITDFRPKYFRGSYAERLKTLQTIMDNEGYVADGSTGLCYLLVQDRKRIRVILDLIRGLGIRAHLRGECIEFIAYKDFPVFRDKNKLKWLSYSPDNRCANERYIRQVKQVASRPVRCISVDSPDSLFLAGEGMVPTHNSTLAIYTQAYQTYLLSCMANPHEVFDLDPSSEILIVFQSVTKNVATDVDYRRLRDMMGNSPYFTSQFPFDQSRESEMRFPLRVGIKPVIGHDQGAIGQNVIGGILDEINFMSVVENSKKSTSGGMYDQALQNYNSIASRRQSRFMQLGHLPGMLCLVSSRNYPGQFTDRKEEEAKTNPRIYIYDKRLWDLRPERFSGETFSVFVGDSTRKPRILADMEIPPKSDIDLVMDIPVEYRMQFNMDILSALREVAGMSTQAMFPFMGNTDAISEAFGHHDSILSRDVCDFKTTRVFVYPKRFVNLDMPRFAHIDPSLSRDSTGLVVGHVPRFVEVDRGDVLEQLPVIQIDFILEVKPPRNGEIEHSNIRRLLYTLRDSGLPILWVTSDTFQSSDNLQILRQQNFIVGEQSMDTSTDAYDVTKQAIYDGRLVCPSHAKAQRELSTLELNPENQKVDHRPSGSKDLADAIAGVTYGLARRREVWSKHGVSMRNRPRQARKDVDLQPPADNLTYVQLLRRKRSEERLAERLAEEKK